MIRASLLTTVLALGGAAHAATSEAVTLRVARGTVHGTLLTPGGPGPFPVALLVVGSGPTDRNGNSPLLPAPINSFRALAEALAERGVATLRYDKIGIAQSQAAALDLAAREGGAGLFRAEVASIGGWTQKLRADPRFTDVTVVGHSQGAHMSLLAGRAVRPDRLVALAGQGTDVRSLLDRQLSAQLPPELMTDVRAVLGRVRTRGTADLPPTVAGVPSLAALFTGVNGAYLAQWMKTDPAAQAARLTVPLLVVHGDADAQVTLDEARRLHAARPGLPLRIVPGMSHVLKQATPEPASQAAAYSNPAVPLATGLADLLATFIKTGR